ncbi:MAG TPA: low temperature requirement protein A [Pilimelia sp.]|nr:low temperature requirement protein A [Pilimelia sp.]
MATTDEALDEEQREQDELVRPPDLNQDSNRSATRLELFFDLAFVLFVARCADLLAKNETWSGAAAFVALLSIGWWAWASTTLYANRFDTDDTIFRLLMLTGMAGVVAMAAGVDAVTGPAGRWFALAYVLLRLVLVAGYVRAWRHVPDARPTVRLYLSGHAAGAAIWLASVAVDGPARYVLWGVGVAVDLAGPALATRLTNGVPLHMEHLPERFGLFIILVLGESVAGIVTGLHDATWSGGAVVTALPAFLIGVALWWNYFDLTGGAAKRRLLREDDQETRHGVQDFYVFAHLPLALSLAAVAVGLEHAVLHGADEHLGAGTRWVLAIGLAGYLASSTLIQGVLAQRLRDALLWPGLGVPAVLAATLVDLSPAAVLGLLAAILVMGAGTGMAQRRRGDLRTAKV